MKASERSGGEKKLIKMSNCRSETEFQLWIFSYKLDGHIKDDSAVRDLVKAPT